MSSDGKALQALRTMNEFDVLDAAGNVARAMHARQSLQQRTQELRLQCGDAAMHLRGAMSRGPLDPALVAALQRSYRIEQHMLRERQAQLAGAERREDEALAMLARLRGKQRSIEEALHAEAGKTDLRRRSAEASRVDDLWLQRRGAGKRE